MVHIVYMVAQEMVEQLVYIYIYIVICAAKLLANGENGTFVMNKFRENGKFMRTFLC